MGQVFDAPVLVSFLFPGGRCRNLEVVYSRDLEIDSRKTLSSLFEDVELENEWLREPHPTWNYVAVHLHGTARLVSGVDEARQIVFDFVLFYEADARANRGPSRKMRANSWTAS